MRFRSDGVGLGGRRVASSASCWRGACVWGWSWSVTRICFHLRRESLAGQEAVSWHVPSTMIARKITRKKPKCKPFFFGF